MKRKSILTHEILTPKYTQKRKGRGSLPAFFIKCIGALKYRSTRKTRKDEDVDVRHPLL
jgi:hypothetical protein